MEDIVVVIERCPNYLELRDKWIALEAKNKDNFFLSWYWIGTWLDSLNGQFWVIEAKKDNHTLGIGLLVEHSEFRHGFIYSKQLHLHRTGSAELDQIWIEYNDFLIQPEYRDFIRLKMMEAVSQQLNWDEFVLGVAEQNVVNGCSLANLHAKNTWVTTSYQVDLDQVRKNGKPYIDTLSRNTRYQIRRSQKNFEAKGNLTIEKASTKEQAISWFSAAAECHIKRWQHTQVGSGFTNPKFVKFHQQLIDVSFDKQHIDILKITAGEQVVGYLYNFIYGNIVRFYLSAIHYEDSDNKLKPGLLAHYLVIEYYLKQGFNLYDFMGGDSRYKKSFATSTFPIYLTAFQKDKYKFKVERQLQILKRGYFSELPHIEEMPKLDILITGGKQCITEKGKFSYDQAKILQIQLNNNALPIVTEKIIYSSPTEVKNTETAITFKAGSIQGGELNCCTETEILSFSLPNFEKTAYLSLPFFNDLHHVTKRENGNYLVVSTGLDAVFELTTIGEIINEWSVNHNDIWQRFDKKIDYRHVSSTKPHMAHPNFVFELNEQIWVTRCDLMDAICLDDRSKRLNIGGGLVHDGVVMKNKIYFTTVNGFVKVFDTQSLALVHTFDLNQIYGDASIGWCRGILPIGNNYLVVGFSRHRSSKHQFSNKNSLPTRVTVFDVQSQKVVVEIDLEAYDLNAVFSILPGEM